MDPFEPPHNYDDGYGDGPDGPSPEELAEDCGLSGKKFLFEKYDDETRKAIGIVISEKLGEEFVVPKDLLGLHPDMNATIAELYACDMTLSLAHRRIRRELDGTSQTFCNQTDFRQVMNGTTLASEEALSALAYAARTSTQKIVSEAMDRRWEFHHDLRLPNVPIAELKIPDPAAKHFPLVTEEEFLFRDYSDLTREAIAVLLSEKLGDSFILPKDLRILHSEVDDDFTSRFSRDLSLHLAGRKIARDLPGSKEANCRHQDFQQVLGGTLTAKRSALSALAYAAGTSTQAIVEEAIRREEELLG